MGIKKYKPTSAGRRGMTGSDFAEVTRSRPEKSLVESLRKKGGRNNRGRITVRHHGGGHKRRYRIIDFRRDKWGVPGTVATVEYDPNRSARIALIHFADGEKRYILQPVGLKVGDKVITSNDADIQPGNCMELARIPVGMNIHAIELIPNQGAALARSAGQSAVLRSREGKYAQVKLSSGEVRRINVKCRATIGVVGNSEHQKKKIGKAGKKRYQGKRPHVRGVAMNPVDHPMGGGEGRTSGGGHPVSPWGQLAKGKKTRNPRKSKKMIVEDRKKR